MSGYHSINNHIIEGIRKILFADKGVAGDIWNENDQLYYNYNDMELRLKYDVVITLYNIILYDLNILC